MCVSPVPFPFAFVLFFSPFTIYIFSPSLFFSFSVLFSCLSSASFLVCAREYSSYTSTGIDYTYGMVSTNHTKTTTKIEIRYLWENGRTKLRDLARTRRTKERSPAGFSIRIRPIANQPNLVGNCTSELSRKVWFHDHDLVQSRLRATTTVITTTTFLKLLTSRVPRLQLPTQLPPTSPSTS